MNEIKVLVADDTAIGREGMRRVIEDSSRMEVVGEATSPPNVVLLAKELQPDAVLLDLRWFGDPEAGASIIPQILEVAPQTKVIGITAYDELMTRARQLGAVAAVTKDITRQQLREVVQGVCNAASGAIPTPVPGESGLTERERQVLALVVDGLKDREIAERLGITESTAKNHVSSILGKLEVINRTQAAVAAVRRKLV
jgi:DNA-binding NarL/FixJ family response regulator